MTTSRFPQNIVGFKIFMMLILKASGSVMMCGFSARTSTFSLFSIIALLLHSQQAPTFFCPQRWCDKVFHAERVKFTNGADSCFFFCVCVPVMGWGVTMEEQWSMTHFCSRIQYGCMCYM